MDMGTFATGILTGLGTSVLAVTLSKRLFNALIDYWFKKYLQTRDIIGKAQIQYRQQHILLYRSPGQRQAAG